MKPRHIFLYLIIMIGLLGFWKLFFLFGDLVQLTESREEGFPQTGYDYLILVVRDFLAVGILCLIAAKLGILKIGGFSGSGIKNPWMLLIPLIFPGLIMLRLDKLSCLDPSFLLVCFIIYKLLAGVLEEVMFRGLILGHLRTFYPNRSLHFYCSVTALFFSAMHLINLTNAPLISVIPQLVYAFFMGLLFGVLLIRVRNVWLLGLVHGVLNILTLDVCKTLAGTQEGTYSDSAGDIASSVLGFLIMSLPVFLTYYVLVVSYKSGLPVQKK